MLSKVNDPAAVDSVATDECLMLRVRERRDERALEELVRRYERPLYNYLVRYTGNPTKAEEIFYGTFERVFERRQQFDERRRFKPWLFSIATHLAIDSLRKGGRHRHVALDAPIESADASQTKLMDLLRDNRPSPIAQLEATERRDWVRAAVADLPESMRGVVLMAYYERMKLHEIAEALGIPEGTVKSRLHRALLELNRAWKSGHRGEAA
ncbi:MAG TPA: sigma-70 family RNA polymerase sigma factor [Pirellulales bacterium]|nr:sigma-70 family RNA polymerase sigma factor [Pirellulales bacterium]